MSDKTISELHLSLDKTYLELKRLINQINAEFKNTESEPEKGWWFRASGPNAKWDPVISIAYGIRPNSQWKAFKADAPVAALYRDVTGRG